MLMSQWGTPTGQDEQLMIELLSLWTGRLSFAITAPFVSLKWVIIWILVHFDKFELPGWALSTWSSHFCFVQTAYVDPCIQKWGKYTQGGGMSKIQTSVPMVGQVLQLDWGLSQHWTWKANFFIILKSWSMTIAWEKTVSPRQRIGN